MKSGEVLEKELERRNVKISRKALTNYVHKRIIPEDFVIIEKRGFRKYFYFKPEVVDLLERKLSASV
ncbi:MAG: hypothetical protein Q9N34_09195 [Aquificota bacterium]|nr:hypothetical protein [Aquificota bacterium]